MGEVFLIANVDKRQYVSASAMNESGKRAGFLGGLHGRAVALLVCKSDAVGHGYGALAGSWYGDRLIAVGDQNEVVGAHEVGPTTSEAPGTTLYQHVREAYSDISLEAVAMLCRGDSQVVEALVQAAGSSSASLIVAGDTVYLAGSQELEHALRERYGSDWIRRYQRACEARLGREGGSRPN